MNLQHDALYYISFLCTVYIIHMYTKCNVHCLFKHWGPFKFKNFEPLKNSACHVIFPNALLKTKMKRGLSLAIRKSMIINDPNHERYEIDTAFIWTPVRGQMKPPNHVTMVGRCVLSVHVSLHCRLCPEKPIIIQFTYIALICFDLWDCFLAFHVNPDDQILQNVRDSFMSFQKIHP